MVIHPLVLHSDAPRELRWKGSLIIPGLFAGVHTFRIENTGTNRVRLVQDETFSGILVPLLLPLLIGIMRRGFEGMNVAMKQVAENGSHSEAQ